VHLISREEFEHADPIVAETQANRTRIEYYFTCTPALPYYVLRQNEQINLITYIDADLFFYSSPQPIFDELGNGSVAITPHRFTPALKMHEVSGLHNVGWLSFRRDQSGLACLEWWRERCVEWCYDRVEDGKFADQKYLDSFTKMFDGVVSLQHIGVNVALWNIGNYRLWSKNNHVMIDEAPLVFFHFHGLKYLGWHVYHTGAAYFLVQLPKIAIEGIYRPYLQTAAIHRDKPHKGMKRLKRAELLKSLVDDAYRYYYIAKDAWRGNCLIA
jgi:hypothetical protein